MTIKDFAVKNNFKEFEVRRAIYMGEAKALDLIDVAPSFPELTIIKEKKRFVVIDSKYEKDLVKFVQFCKKHPYLYVNYRIGCNKNNDINKIKKDLLNIFRYKKEQGNKKIINNKLLYSKNKHIPVCNGCSNFLDVCNFNYKLVSRQFDGKNYYIPKKISKDCKSSINILETIQIKQKNINEVFTNGNESIK